MTNATAPLALTARRFTNTQELANLKAMGLSKVSMAAQATRDGNIETMAERLNEAVAHLTDYSGASVETVTRVVAHAIVQLVEGKRPKHVMANVVR